MFKRVIFGPVISAKVEALHDLNITEVSAFTLLAMMVLAMGIYPKPILDYVHQSASETLVLLSKTKL